MNNPYILKYAADDIERRDLRDEDGRPLTSEAKAYLLHTAHVRSLGYKDAEPISNSECEDLSVQVFKTAELSEKQGSVARLFEKPMTAGDVEVDPNVTCKPVYAQIYRPPVKIGEKCDAAFGVGR